MENDNRWCCKQCKERFSNFDELRLHFNRAHVKLYNQIQNWLNINNIVPLPVPR